MNYNDKKTASPSHTDQDKAVKDIKQPNPTNQSVRKTDPSKSSFEEEEE